MFFICFGYRWSSPGTCVYIFYMCIPYVLFDTLYDAYPRLLLLSLFFFHMPSKNKSNAAKSLSLKLYIQQRTDLNGFWSLNYDLPDRK